MANEITIRVTAKDDASKVFDLVDKKARGLGETFATVGKLAAGIFAAQVGSDLFGKITSGMGNAVKSASDLKESVNAVNQIFGESAQVIQDWGKNNATQFGLSQRAFNQLATPLGAMLKSQGFQDFSGLTVELTKRAADMASVFNTDVTDALMAVQAALRGELDPIERYGVALNAAKVEARALADTGKTVASALTDQEKAAARVALIFEQTAAVQGDFAATSDEAANKARIQAARAEELAATLGTKLLPIQLKITEAKLAFVAALTTKVIPALEALYAKHWPAVERAIKAITPVVEFMVNDVAAKIGGFVGMVKSIAEIFSGVVAAIDAVVRGDWGAVWENFKTVAESGAKLAVNAAVAALGSLPNVMIGIMEQVLNIVIDGWNKVAKVFSKEVDFGLGNVNPLSGQDLTQGNVNLPRLPQMSLPFGEIGNALKDLTGSVGTVDEGMVNLAVNTGAASTAMKSIADKLSEALNATFGRGTREETALALAIAEAEKRLMNAGSNEGLRKLIEKEIETLRNKQGLMEKDNQIAQLKIDLADQTLLTEREQNAMTAILIRQTQTLTSQMEYAATAAGKFAQALGVAIGNTGPVYDYSSGAPIERRDLELNMGRI